MPLVLGAVALLATSISAALAATGSAPVTVSMTVPSASSINVAGCATGAPDITDFGVMLPGTQAVTGSDCTVTFGSSNDTAMLQVAQSDRSGVGMFQMTRGVLDPAFDGDAGPGDGRVVNDLGSGDWDWGRAVAVDDLNRMVVLSSIDDNCCYRRAVISRYAANGTLDTSFDGDGVSIEDFPELGWEYGEDLALQDDGKYVVVGWGTNGANQDLVVARYLTDGTLDPSFAGDGDVAHEFAPGDNVKLQAVAIQPDGGIIGVGDNNAEMAVVRLNPDGSFDESFDGPGPAGDGAFVLSATPGFDYADDVAVQDDGKIVIAGHTGFDAPDRMVFARLEADGTLDPDFDGPGAPGNGGFRMAFNAGLGSGLQAVAIAADGDILGTGWASNGANSDAVVVRLNPDGTLDTDFSGDGKVVIAGGPGYQSGMSILEQPDGRILVTGTAEEGGDDQVLLARVNADGTIDSDLDGDPAAGAGQITTDFTGTDDVGRDMALLPDGDVVVVGGTNWATGDTLLARYEGLAHPDYNGGANGFGTEMFGACLSATSATPDWTVNATCPAVNGAYWNAVTATSDKIAHTTVVGTVGASVDLRFGASLASSQSPGIFVAPMTFEAVAPNI